MNIKKHIIIISALIGLGISTSAQKGVISPYSAIGLGDLVYGGMLHQTLSGGLGAAFNNNLLSNTTNPASLGFLKSTAFEFSATYQYSFLQENGKTFGIQNGNPDYVSLSFPLSNPVTELLQQKERKFNWGMGFNLLPYSRVGYDLSDTSYYDDSLLIVRNSTATGGTYLFQWSNGVRYHDFSLGLSLGYLFGNIRKERQVLPDVRQNPNISFFSDKARIKAFHWRLGMMYERHLNPGEVNSKKRKTLTTGLYFSSPQKLSGTVDRFYRTQRAAFGGQSNPGIRDTLVNASTPLEGGKLPLEVGTGLYYDDHQHHSMGVDFAYSDWKGFDSNILNPGGDISLATGYRLGIGGIYTPSAGDVNFFRRMSYHYGFHYNYDPRIVNDHHVTDLGISGGVTLPVYYIRQVTYLHLGLQVGRAGIASGILDNYFKVSLGVTFNDNSWFLKRRFN